MKGILTVSTNLFTPLPPVEILATWFPSPHVILVPTGTANKFNRSGILLAVSPILFKAKIIESGDVGTRYSGLSSVFEKWMHDRKDFFIFIWLNGTWMTGRQEGWRHSFITLLHPSIHSLSSFLLSLLTQKESRDQSLQYCTVSYLFFSLGSRQQATLYYVATAHSWEPQQERERELSIPIQIQEKSSVPSTSSTKHPSY